MKLNFVSAAATGFFTSYSMLAAEELEVGLGATSLGVTLESRYIMSENFSIRGIYAGGLSQSFNETQDSVDYSIKGNVGGFALLADYHPTGGSFVISSGIFSSATSIDLRATVTNQTFGNSANVTGSLSGKAKFKNKTVPMLLLGYKERASPLDIKGDIGAIFTGGFSLSASSSDGIAQADIDAELADTASEMNKVNYYPFIGLTVSYSF